MNLRVLGLTLICLVLPLYMVEGAETEFGGDGRYFQFGSFGEVPGGRNHAELGIFRLKLDSFFNEELRFEAHGVLQVSSPAQNDAVLIASGTTRRALDLEYEFNIGNDTVGVLELDRLNLRWDRPSFRLVAGRQTMTWGVNYFWPVLDLFAPFAPERIDREYKPGIDAVRLTAPLGDFSEIEIVAAGQGKRFPEDLSLASLGRFHVGTTDLGYMGGRFHTDTVVGGFVAAEASGTAIRAEVAFTQSGDDSDAQMDREQFWRASFGLDRQLIPDLNLTFEGHFSGFGADAPEDYVTIAQTDRVSRGEVTSLGRYYTGLSLLWRAHPLLNLSATVLTNWGDRSVLVQPAGEWSATEGIVVQIGGIFGLGPGLDENGQLQSEYGFVPSTLWGAFKIYF